MTPDDGLDPNAHRRRRPRRIWLLTGATAAAAAVAVAVSAHHATLQALDPLEAAIQAGWQAGWHAQGAPQASHQRLWLEQDPTQRACTLYGNAPPERVAVTIMQREWRGIAFPVDGQVFGDWQRGEALARDTGIDRAKPINEPASTDEPRRAAGQCLACHQLDARDGGAGNSGPNLLGPSLSGYGRRRGFALSERTLLYEQIYNSNAVIACSMMPRYGPHKVLTPEQIRDIVAYLLSPQSPVNAAAAGER